MRHPIEQETVDRFLRESSWFDAADDPETIARSLESGCPIFLGWGWRDLLPFVRDWQGRAESPQLAARPTE